MSRFRNSVRNMASLVLSREEFEEPVGEDAEVAAAEEAGEVQADIADMETATDTMSDIAEDHETLDNVSEIVDDSIESGEGLSEPAAAVVQETVESIYRRHGMPRRMWPSMPATENFGKRASKAERLKATRAIKKQITIATEGFWDTIKKLWKQVCDFIKGIWNKIFGKGKSSDSDSKNNADAVIETVNTLSSSEQKALDASIAENEQIQKYGAAKVEENKGLIRVLGVLNKKVSEALKIKEEDKRKEAFEALKSLPEYAELEEYLNLLQEEESAGASGPSNFADLVKNRDEAYKLLEEFEKNKQEVEQGVENVNNVVQSQSSAEQDSEMSKLLSKLAGANQFLSKAAAQAKLKTQQLDSFIKTIGMEHVGSALENAVKNKDIDRVKELSSYASKTLLNKKIDASTKEIYGNIVRASAKFLSRVGEVAAAEKIVGQVKNNIKGIEDSIYDKEEKDLVNRNVNMLSSNSRTTFRRRRRFS